MNYSKWSAARCCGDAPEALLAAGYPPLLASMLAVRGIETEERAREFLDGDSDCLRDPMLFKGMDKAVSRIKSALGAGETFAVYGDYDVDGITATCLLSDWLRSKGAECLTYIPDRIAEGYGLNCAAIDKLKAQGVSLIISVDCGITAAAEAKYAKEIGVDIIITDHHECREETLPSAVAVIDAKQPDCPYPNKELAGKPVVFKIKLHDVCVRQLPALNSDFAKKMGKETMEEYRAFVKQQLFDGRHGGALNHAKDQILGQLADAAEGEIPSILVENAYQQQMQGIQQQLQMQRMSLNTYLSQIHETRESFTAKVRAAAEKNTRARMALLQIAQQENLLPTDEEIDKQLAERAEKTKKTVEEIKAGTDIAALRRNEGIRKAADWVIDHSTIEEKVESK